MPTKDIIEYDVATLQTFSVDSLLLQLIARKDLERPNREQDLKTSIVKVQLDQKVADLLKQFEALQLPTVVAAIKSVYEGVFEE